MNSAKENLTDDELETIFQKRFSKYKINESVYEFPLSDKSISKEDWEIILEKDKRSRDLINCSGGEIGETLLT